MNVEPENQELQRIPKTTQEVDLETGKKVLLIIEKFEDDDDVNNVWHNLEIDRGVGGVDVKYTVAVEAICAHVTAT